MTINNLKLRKQLNEGKAIECMGQKQWRQGRSASFKKPMFSLILTFPVDIDLLYRYDFELNGYSYPEMVEETGPLKPGNLLSV